jgi:predicted  nucleic acid-binding Zn-ribbon protein
MGMPARKFEFEEVPVEERLARLESKVEHIQSDVSEMKVDIRRLNDKIDGVDQRLSAKIDGVDQKLTAKFDSLKDLIAAQSLTMEKSISRLTVWAITLFISMASGFLTFLGRSLHWF